MSPAEKHKPTAFKRHPIAERIADANSKYDDAVTLYASLFSFLKRIEN